LTVKAHKLAFMASWILSVYEIGRSANNFADIGTRGVGFDKEVAESEREAGDERRKEWNSELDVYS